MNHDLYILLFILPVLNQDSIWSGAYCISVLLIYWYLFWILCIHFMKQQIWSTTVAEPRFYMIRGLTSIKMQIATRARKLICNLL